jgi:hypothetical protein
VLIRVFRGVIREGAHEAMLRELHDDIVPMMESHPDVSFVSLGLPWESSPDEYLLESHWSSAAAIEAALGPDWRTPAVEDMEEELLTAVYAHHYVPASGPIGTASLPGVEPAVVLVGPVRIDARRRRVSWDGSSTVVAPREMAALIALACDPGAPVAAGDLARRIWPGSVVVTAYDVRRVVYQLRGALAAAGIPLAVRNVRGSGYCLDPVPA